MEEIEIRPYKESDWAELARIHDSARLVELEWAGLSNAFLPFSEAAVREHLFDYSVCVALLKGLVCGFAAYSHEELAWLYAARHMQDGELAKRSYNMWHSSQSAH